MIIKKLSELADIILGYPFESNKFNLEGRGVCLVRGMNITERNLRFGEDARYWDELTTELEPYYLKENDILIGMDGSKVGKNFAVVQKEHLPLLLVQRVACIRAKNGVYQPFLWFAIASTNFTNYINTVKTGSSIPHISGKQIGDFQIQIPCYEEQKIVADCLWVIESKIRNNNAICAELEAMAKLLYDYWFVQFDFPDENGKPYKSSGGKMVWSEELKREIPEGWHVNKLGYCIKTSKNGDWGNEHPKTDNDIKVNCFRGADFPSITQDYHMTAPVRYINPKNADRLLSDGDLITEISGGSPTQATGRIGYVNQRFLDRAENSMDCSNFCKAFTPSQRYFQYWLYQTWKMHYEAGVMFNYEGKTTGIKNLMFDDFINSIYLPIPDSNLLEMYQSKCEIIFNGIQDSFIESEELSSLRDFLLPLLMNGQVTFKEADCH